MDTHADDELFDALTPLVKIVSAPDFCFLPYVNLDKLAELLCENDSLDSEEP